MNRSTLIKAAALTAAFTVSLFAQATMSYWVDHKPAPGCKYHNTPGIEIAYHHLMSDIMPADNVTWDDTMPFYLDQDVKVYGQLTVKPGNWIYGGTYSKLNQDPKVTYNSCSYGSSLIIMERGKAHMVGTKDSTIVMTGFGDDYRDLASFGPGVKGMWGGLIIKGLGPVANAPYPAGVYPAMEGIAQYEPDSITVYGKGPVDFNDNSGEYEYLSVRHGGAGRATNSEINGISLYCVGAGTTMDHLEVMSNYDDAEEFFGGNVNQKYVCNSFCDDDQFDIDCGYEGKMQYMFAVELNWMGNRCGEWDNLKHFDDPWHTTKGPTICNMTVLGCGKYTNNTGDAGVDNQNYGANFIWQLADSLKGDYRNIIGMDQMNYAFWMRNHDIKPFGQAPIGNANGPKWTGLMVYHTKAGADDATMTWDRLVFDDNGQAAQSVAWLNTPANKCFCNVDPQLRGVSREFNFAACDPRPCLNSPATSPNAYVANPGDGFFDQTPYVGAFDPNAALWCDGWTKLSQMGCLTRPLSVFPENAVLTANTNFDIMYEINDPSAVPNNASVTLDGNDITGIVLPIFLSNYGPTSCGGTYLKIPGVSGSILAGGNYNYFGQHVLTTSISLNGGKVVTASSRFEIKN